MTPVVTIGKAQEVSTLDKKLQTTEEGWQWEKEWRFPIVLFNTKWSALKSDA